MTVKKWMSFLLAFLLSLSLVSCGGAAPTAVPGPDLTPAAGTAASPSEAPDAPLETPAAEQSADSEQPPAETPAPARLLEENGSYTTKEDVALYLHLYGRLPGNFITKKEAEKLGWSGGSLEPYAPGKCIGGSRFGNYEGLLPDAEGRTWTECDIDTLGAQKRGAKRIVFSNDGLIYYTGDHYESFELLYGEAEP